MDEVGLLGFLGFAFFGGCLAVGLVGGEMPMRYRSADRELDPVRFWFGAALYAAAAALSLRVFLASVL